MEKITNFIEERLAPPLIKISEMRYLQVIQKTFMTTMPILIFSSLLILVAALPIPGWSEIVAPFAGKLWAGVNSTLGLLSVCISIVTGYFLGEYYKNRGSKIKPIMTALIGFLSFLMFFPMFSTEDGKLVIEAANFGSSGMFSSLFISIIAVEIYRFLINKNFTIKLPEGVPPMVLDAFTALIPSMVVLLISWFISHVLSLDIPTITNKVFAPLVSAGKTPLPQFLSFFLDRVLWFTGIHGSNVVGSVMAPIWTTMITENMEAYKAGAEVIPNLFTTEWCGYFIRISVLPIAFLAARSKVKRYSTLGKLSLPASIFNIAEPVMFGLPLVLNPILFIPWVFGFSFLWIWTYIFTAIIPMIPPIITQVTWTVPAPIGAYLGTGGSIFALFFSIANYFILGLIFYPFFKTLERQEMKKEIEGIEEVYENH
ncbi:PTS transporter subunit EIIC [Clostridium sp. AL.422]|uniref:PTS sugar transporter subunit IIC n=1 Tax=Clostridium TaxID=1485 RepID=UPI00293DFBAD|nr:MULTISPECIES: PTS transporter subunit EIIC [unclassified Clostridium]MDV4152015.1 PTS transporter subunit EIIC [Clostridium sp. AL.422]